MRARARPNDCLDFSDREALQEPAHALERLALVTKILPANDFTGLVDQHDADEQAAYIYSQVSHQTLMSPDDGRQESVQMMLSGLNND